MEPRNLFAEKNNREALLLNGDDGEVAEGGDAIDGGVVGELPHHPVPETGRFKAAAGAVTGNPDWVVFIDFGGEPFAEEGVARIDDGTAAIMFFHDFEPCEHSPVQFRVAAAGVNGLNVQNGRKVLVTDIADSADEILCLLFRRLGAPEEMVGSAAVASLGRALPVIREQCIAMVFSFCRLDHNIAHSLYNSRGLDVPHGMPLCIGEDHQRVPYDVLLVL